MRVVGVVADDEPAAPAPPAAEPAWERPTLREAVALLGRRRFRALVAIGGGLALVTVSDGFA